MLPTEILDLEDFSRTRKSQLRANDWSYFTPLLLSAPNKRKKLYLAQNSECTACDRPIQRKHQEPQYDNANELDWLKKDDRTDLCVRCLRHELIFHIEWPQRLSKRAVRKRDPDEMMLALNPTDSDMTDMEGTLNFKKGLDGYVIQEKRRIALYQGSGS